MAQQGERMAYNENRGFWEMPFRFEGIDTEILAKPTLGTEGR